MAEVTVGSRAPALSLPRDDGGVFDLAAAKGPVVVFFYPKADSPGCTNEAIDFSGHLAAFRKAGAEVVGVSRDPVKKLARFRAKHDLKTLLASDEGGEITEAWGVWVEKQLYGRKYMGVERTTFLIDQGGKIARIWNKVKVPGHAAEVLEAAKSL